MSHPATMHVAPRLMSCFQETACLIFSGFSDLVKTFGADDWLANFKSYLGQSMQEHALDVTTAERLTCERAAVRRRQLASSR